MVIKCIDVSDHQKKINWSKVKKAGINHAIIRAGYGKGNADGQWKANIDGAIKAGIEHIGVYWFSYAYSLTMAVNEANFCYKLVKPYTKHIDLGVYFDWEYDSMNYARKMKKPANKERITAMTKAFCERIKALGLTPGFYYNYDYKKNYYDLSALPYINWYALDKSNGEYRSVKIQQYGVDSIPGIKGKVDVNWIFEDAKPVKPSKLPAIPARGYFKIGDKGEGVKWIQKKLNAKNQGDILHNKLKVDGIFGDKTEVYVKLFQDARHLKIDGKVGVITLDKLEKAKITARNKAVNFAVSIARNNSFNYGTGDRAHHNGCYFCGTNIKGPKKAKKGDKWEKTYCCNPFIHAAYAHGAEDAKMLKACQTKKAAGLKVKDWEKFGFKNMGKCSKVKFSDLKIGDVILKVDSHVFMYTGKGWFVEASGNDKWDGSSIAHKKTAKDRYKSYAKHNNTYVLRYKG